MRRELSLADPLSARAHSLLGSAILASGDFRNSVEEFRTALTLNDNDSLGGGRIWRWLISTRIGSTPRSEACDARSHLEPDEPDYIFHLGQATARK